MDSSSGSQLGAIVRYIYEPVDNASVTCFRIAWGAIVATWAWGYLTEGRVTSIYVEPQFHFTYVGFDWVQPWSGGGMYWHFWGLLLLAIAVAAGFFYRVATLLFAIGFTYLFLLEQTNYQNHYYLMLLISWSLCFLPLNHGLSWDARRFPTVARDTCPRWVLICLQLHVAIPYFYGGLAKLVPDWLLGQPMGIMLQGNADLPLVGGFFSYAYAGLIMSWLGLLFDLLIVPALIWKRTRLFAYLACLIFHLSNSVIFSIHIFPWFMIAATTLFFEPDWPRRVLGGRAIKLPSSEIRGWVDLSTLRKIALVLSAGYLSFHLTWPLRHRFYEGESSWNERGHFFSWRMMLRGKTGGVRYFITDPVKNKTFSPDHRQFLGAQQAGKFPRNPDWIVHFAHFLDQTYGQRLGTDVEVRAIVMLSLNGRKPQLLLDPNRDLSEVFRGQANRPWVLPLEEPLRQQPWSVPLAEWERFVELPPLEFLKENPITAGSDSE